MQNLLVNSSSIIPMVSEGETQLVFQRHCSYDRNNGNLVLESVNYQKSIILSFINNLDIEDLQNTYFLFTSSNTTSSIDFKRCVETTNIAMDLIKQFLEQNHVSSSHIMNLNENSNYNDRVRESRELTEPQMFTDSTGYFEYLKEKHNGINTEFWIDFEEDLSKEKREQLNSEGPDQIVERADHYVNMLQRYASYFHNRHKKSKLIVWCGTHYDLISPLVKQKILHCEKSDIVKVDYCGGISLVINDSNEVIANVNGVNYPFDFQENKQLHRHF